MFAKMHIFSLLLLFVNHIVHPANILAVFPLASKSHAAMSQHLLEELAKRGHKIDVISPLLSKNPPKGYVQYSLENSIPALINNLTLESTPGEGTIALIYFIAYTYGVRICEAAFSSPVLQDFWKNIPTNHHYDLVLTEIFGSDCMLGFGHMLRVPTISILTSIDLPWGGSRIGNPDNPSFIRSYFNRPQSGTTIWTRLENTVNMVLGKVLYWWIQLEADQLAKKFFAKTLPNLNELALNTSLILINSINQVRPTIPNFIEVGGLHIRPVKQLNRHFDQIMQQNPNGIILFTFGSMVKTDSLTLEKLQIFCRAFGALKQTVLWRGDVKLLPKDLVIPSNVRFEKWLPQMDILCHNNTKAFITHGGLMSSQEAIYCGVPRVGIPLFSDQKVNIQQAEMLGIGIRVGYDDLTAAKLLNAITNLLNKPTYKENCMRISKLFKDRPLSALDTAIYWVEYVIRYKGAPHLKNSSTELTWYQYYLYDVALAIILALFLFLYVMYRISCYAIRTRQRIKYKTV